MCKGNWWQSIISPKCQAKIEKAWLVGRHCPDWIIFLQTCLDLFHWRIALFCFQAILDRVKQEPFRRCSWRRVAWMDSRATWRFLDSDDLLLKTGGLSHVQCLILLVLGRLRQDGQLSLHSELQTKPACATGWDLSRHEVMECNYNIKVCQVPGACCLSVCFCMVMQFWDR